VTPLDPAVSVVTPFHDTAEYLSQCIESVLGQTRRDFEYVLLDNASTDGGGAIAERYAARDPRIRFLRADRLRPQVANYNHALRQIGPASRWVKIVQADDWLFPRCLEEMVAVGDRHPTAGVVSSYRLEGRLVDADGHDPERTLISGRDARRLHLLDELFLFGSPTTVMYRADLVRARADFYAEGRLHEDTELVYELLRDHDLAFVHQVLSATRQQPGAIMTGARTFNPTLMDRLILVERYGHECLTPEELARVRKEDLATFYDGLARAVVERRGDDFWDYQRRGLATIGLTIDRAHLARAVVAHCAKAALAPGAALRRLRERARRS
jgi:glycosyltransferase involved in cell wall biosynthesis